MTALFQGYGGYGRSMLEIYGGDRGRPVATWRRALQARYGPGQTLLEWCASPGVS
jgi:hypothetical protein